MTAIVLRRIVLTLLAAFAGVCWLDQLMNPSPIPLLIDAGLVRRSDFSVCIPVRPPPLGPQPTNKIPFPRRPDTA